ncbi:MAG: hypothetical protein ACAI38_24105 [Myxococcota bacterium]
MTTVRLQGYAASSAEPGQEKQTINIRRDAAGRVLDSNEELKRTSHAAARPDATKVAALARDDQAVLELTAALYACQTRRVMSVAVGGFFLLAPFATAAFAGAVSTGVIALCAVGVAGSAVVWGVEKLRDGNWHRRLAAERVLAEKRAFDVLAKPTEATPAVPVRKVELGLIGRLFAAI